MPKDKVEKLSISLPSSFAAHVRCRVAQDDLKGVSEYFQRLVAQDIGRAKRTAARSIRSSGNIQHGLDDLASGRVLGLDPTTVDLIVQERLTRIAEKRGGEEDLDLRE